MGHLLACFFKRSAFWRRLIKPSKLSFPIVMSPSPSFSVHSSHHHSNTHSGTGAGKSLKRIGGAIFNSSLDLRNLILSSVALLSQVKMKAECSKTKGVCSSIRKCRSCPWRRRRGKITQSMLHCKGMAYMGLQKSSPKSS